MVIGHIKGNIYTMKERLMIFCTASTNNIDYYFPKWI